MGELDRQHRRREPPPMRQVRDGMPAVAMWTVIGFCAGMVLGALAVLAGMAVAAWP